MSRTIRKKKEYDIGEVPSKFKKFQRKKRRAQEKEAMNEGKEPPIFRKTDEWDYF